jgi:hypothetical protein
MRPTRARTILLVLLAAVAALLFVVGQPRPAAGLVIIVLVIAGMMFGVRRFLDRPRGDAYADASKAAGLSPAEWRSAELLALPHPLIARPERFRDVSHVLEGTWQEMPVVAFEFTEALGTHDAATTDHGRHLCVLLPAPGRADVAIAPSDHGRAPETKGDDPETIADRTDPSLREWLAEIDPAIGFQVADERLLVYRPRAQPWVLPELLETGAAFLERVPARG